MSCNKSNCVIARGLTIMDRCPECDKIENAAKEEERVARNAAFASRWSRVDAPVPGVVADRVDAGESLREFVASCECGEGHPDGTSFFVSVQEDGSKGRSSLLLGPYNTHTEALANVDRGRKLAEETDGRAHWYSFGTASISEPTDRKGVFGK